MTNERIAKFNICRRCLNQYCRFRFKQYELKYRHRSYSTECSQCGQMRHIVKGVKTRYAWKRFFIQDPGIELHETMEDKKVDKFLRRRKLKVKLKRWFDW